MKLATFDIEAARGFPDNTDWKAVAPIGISCAAIAYSDSDKPFVLAGNAADDAGRMPEARQGSARPDQTRLQNRHLERM